MAKAKLSKLKTATHKGRPTRTAQNPYHATAGKKTTRLSSLSGMSSNSQLTSAKLTRITPTPTGPDPYGGRKVF